jgi:threonine synthase
MKDLSEKGVYAITDEMKAGLDMFVGGYATEEQTADAIRRLYKAEGYVIDPHTAVAAHVYDSFRAQTGDRTPAVIASTASPFKFENSVMSALGEPADLPDLELADRLSEKAGVAVPEAVNVLRTAEVRHNTVCDRSGMKDEVRKFLGL